MWIVRVLPLDMLDGMVRFSSFSGHLVSNGRQVLNRAILPQLQPKAATLVGKKVRALNI
jgi:hypothetical protein